MKKRKVIFNSIILIALIFHNNRSNAQTIVCNSGIIPGIDETKFVKPNYKLIKESTFKINFEKSTSFLPNDAKKFINRTNNIVGFDLVPENITFKNLNNISSSIKDKFCVTISKKLLNTKLFFDEKDYKQAINKLSIDIKNCIFKDTYHDGFAFSIIANIPDFYRKPTRKIKMWTKEIVLIPFKQNGKLFIRYLFLNGIIRGEILIDGKMAARVVAGVYNRTEEIEYSKKIIKTFLYEQKYVFDFCLEDGETSYPLKKLFDSLSFEN